MNANNFFLKCYAKPEGGQWVAVCLDFCLAAQADTFEEAKKKLEIMINEYLVDIFEGDDAAYAYQLLTRKAPISQWLFYYFIKAVGHIKKSVCKIFMVPCVRLKVVSA